MEDWQACSLILYHILNYMGYCSWVINARKQYHSDHGKRHGVLISGSKGEGLTNLLQSDEDVLSFNDHICGTFDNNCEGTVKVEDPTRYMFSVERDWSPPGYCMLLLASRPTRPIRCDNIECSLHVIDNGMICLSSTDLLNCAAETFKTDQVKTAIAGPSQPTIVGIFEQDNVSTFSCPCTAELDAWYKRPRHHDWPSKSLQHDVISTPANVVSAGSKDGVFEKMEWRFCFNRSELKLMSSLNPTQTDVYVVLKMILKDHLKPVNKEVTSYVMKNIVLWMCESNPSSSFTPNTLLSWIYVGLQTLKRHIESGNLPYYMIPGRNLLDGKFLNAATKVTFLEKLSKLMESGVGIAHVCKTVQLGLDLYNEGMLEDYGWKRNLAEVGLLRLALCDSKEMKFELLLQEGIDEPQCHLKVFCPDQNSLLEQGHTPEEISKVCVYRMGLFLNHEKAEDFAEWMNRAVHK